jgi:dihydropteroate synthase
MQPSELGFPPPATTLNCRGRVLDLAEPRIMGILNLTPDSFTDGGKYQTPEAALAHAGELLAQGADILDIGGASSRPGAEEVSADEEWSRIGEALRQIRETYPEAILSVDTWRASVARTALALGADIINDISAGQWEPAILAEVAAARAPYILMHTPTKPATMQQNPHYDDVVAEVWDYFVQRITTARAAGIGDIVLDAGFGFGKTLDHNYTLFAALDRLTRLGHPILVGISGKRMVTALFPDQPLEDLAPTFTALHLQALLAGARILRVHHPAPAVQARTLWHCLTA